MVSVEVLENSRCSHPTAHAHGHHAVARLATLELADNAGGQLGASATQRMAESDRATVRIHAFFIQTSFFDDGQRLGGKGLVELDYRNVRKLEAGHLQRLG